MKIYVIIHNEGNSCDWRERVLKMYKSKEKAIEALELIALVKDGKFYNGTEPYVCTEDEFTEFVEYELKEYELD